MCAYRSAFSFPHLAVIVPLLVVTAVSSTSQSARADEQMFGTTSAGDLFVVNVNTAAAVPIGALGAGYSTEIAYDFATGRTFVQGKDGVFGGEEINICTGAVLGGFIPNGGSFTGLEWVYGTLYGTVIFGPGGPSTLDIIDPWSGASVAVGPTGLGPISGLAYDHFSRTMYGITGGAGGASLVTVDLTTGLAAVIGPTGFQAGSLSFGPDNRLYGGGSGPNVGQLWRIDPATGAGTLVGPTGFAAAVTGLTLAWSCTPPPPECELAWEYRASFFDPRTGTGIEGAAASLIGRSIYVSHGYRGLDSNLLSIYDVPTNSWTHGGPTAPNAAAFQSEMGGGTALGRHYSVGGRTGPTAVVEEFDPCTGLWTPMPPLPTARGGLGVASWNNRIYAIGGRDGSTFGVGPVHGENEMFDPATLTWTTLAPLLIPVSDNYATIAWHGRIYVFGGVDASGTVISATQIYDIATNAWFAVRPMPTARAAAMAGVIDGKIAVFGGFDGSSNLTVTELYDPDAISWTTGPPMLVAASEISQGVTCDEANGIFAIGSGIFGADDVVVQVLTHQTAPPLPLTWDTLAPFSDPSASGAGIEGAAASLIDGRIWVSHGFRGFDSALLSMYDIRTDTWTHGLPAAGVARSEMAGGRALGRHYAIGGRNGPTPAVEVLDPVSLTWAPAAAMPTARGGLGAASIGSLIYAIGGRDGTTFGSGVIFGTNEVYDACVDAWAPLAPMPIPVSDNYATIAYNDRIYVFGGATSPFAVTGATQIYDIATGTWSMGAPMPTPRAAAMAGIIAGRIAVYGGYEPVSGANLDVTEIFDPVGNGWSVGPVMPTPVSEIAQGVVYDAGGCYSIGTGIFGASGSPVYRLRCLNESKPVAVETRGSSEPRLALAHPAPNPSRGTVRMTYSVPVPGNVVFDLMDVGGRRVWRTEQQVLTPGEHLLAWDGKTQDGARAAAGMYFIHMKSPAGSRSARIIRVN